MSKLSRPDENSKKQKVENMISDLKEKQQELENTDEVESKNEHLHLTEKEKKRLAKLK